MTHRHAWAYSLVLAALAGAAAQASGITVRLDARDIARKRVHTTMILPVKPGPLTLVYPKWIPGEHGPSGPLDTLIGLDIRAHGAPLAWSRDPLNVFALHLTVPQGVESLDVALETGLASEGNGLTEVPSGTAQLAVLVWNEFLLIPQGVDADTLQVDASVMAPAGWSLVSALDSRHSADGAYQFETSSIARLIDSPVQLGQHARLITLRGSEPRADIPHRLSVMADSEAALDGADELAAGYSRLVAESGALFGSRLYRHYTWLLSLSDHLSYFGLEHHESSDDRINLDILGEPDLRMDLATLLGHEYVHSWNGKYRRPAGLLSPDYQKAMDGSLLWAYEGMTQFWGVVLPTRAGLITPDYCRELLAEWAGNFDVYPGARWRSMADTAVAAQQLYVAPEGWRASRRDTDFYEASVFLWLDVDAELRARTQGRSSLDDFARRFYAGSSGAPQLKPYAEQDIYDGLAAVAPGNWQALIRRHLDLTGTAPLAGGLEHQGWKLVYSAQDNAAIETRQKEFKSTLRRWSIGFDLDKDAKLSDVIDDRAAARAGASPGMTLIAVNGQRYSARVLDAAIGAAQSGHQPIALLVEDGDFYRTLAVEYYDGPRYPHLVRIDSRPDTLAALIKSRVN